MKALFIAMCIGAMTLFVAPAASDAAVWRTPAYYQRQYRQNQRQLQRHFRQYERQQRRYYDRGWNRGLNRRYYRGPGIYIGGPRVGFGVRW